MAGKAPSGFHTSDRPDAAELGLCVHCGFCLNVCPTYLTLGIETDSPRGRIQLMRALDDGRVEASPRVLQHFNQCLQCRACETACPFGVPSGRLMGATHADLFARRPRSLRQRFFWLLIMRIVFLHPARLHLLGRALRAYQRSGLQRFVRAGGWLHGLAPGLATLEAQTPATTGAPFLPGDLKRYGPPETPRARAALLLGCVMPILYGETHHATARVLTP